MCELEVRAYHKTLEGADAEPRLGLGGRGGRLGEMRGHY